MLGHRSHDLSIVGHLGGSVRHDFGHCRALLADLVQLVLRLGDVMLALHPRVLTYDPAGRLLRLGVRLNGLLHHGRVVGVRRVRVRQVLVAVLVGVLVPDAVHVPVCRMLIAAA